MRTLTTMLDDVQIKEVVRERYGALAARAAAENGDADGCCDASCCGEDAAADADSILALYTRAELDDLPNEALAASAGCGNPHAIGALKAGETVVDFGSGGGIDCFIAAKAVGETGAVVGIDMTENMVELARENAAKLGLSNVSFHLAEMERTPLDDDSVDAIISNCVINLAPDKDAVFREAHRILRPGGRLMVSDLVMVDEIPEEEREKSENWVACLAGTEMEGVYLGRMRSAGFESVEVLTQAPWKPDGWQASIHSMNIKAVKPGG